MAFLLHSRTDPAELQGLILSAAEAVCQAARAERRALPPPLFDFRRKMGK